MQSILEQITDWLKSMIISGTTTTPSARNT